jgi:hypothetical protein
MHNNSNNSGGDPIDEVDSAFQHHAESNMEMTYLAVPSHFNAKRN